MDPINRDDRPAVSTAFATRYPLGPGYKLYPAAHVISVGEAAYRDATRARFSKRASNPDVPNSAGPDTPTPDPSGAGRLDIRA